MTIRTESEELQAELEKFGKLFVDDIPNSEQVSDFGMAFVRIVQESADFKNVPKADRLKAIGMAMTKAGIEVIDAGVTYSDETDGGG